MHNPSMKALLLILVVAIVAPRINAQPNPDCICPSNSTDLPSCLTADPCTNAAQVWQWAATVCGIPNPNCAALCNIVRNVVRPYSPSLNQVTYFNATYDWGNLYFGAVMSTSQNNAAQIGELAYTANTINTALKTTPARASPVFLTWQSGWKDLGDRLYNNAQAFLADEQEYSARNSFLRATSAYFLGFIASSRAGLGQTLFESLTNSFAQALDLFKQYDCTTYAIPYTQESVTFNINGNICFPKRTGKFNLVVFVGGLDFPYQQIWDMFAEGALNRGYAITFFDGPGQDAAVEYSRFVKNYELPVGTVINYIKSNFDNRIRHHKIAIMGSSLGGYLAGEVCAGLGTQIDACIINPPLFNTPAVANNLLLGPFFAPILVALQMAPHLIPSGYASLLSNPNSNIFVPLVSNCGAPGKAAVGNVLKAAPVVFPPTLIHICERFAPLPHHSDNITLILENCGYAFEYLQTFVNTRIASINVPVLLLAGRNDSIEQGQEQAFFNQLNPTTQAMSELYFFEPSTGGAMHVQVGAQAVLDEKVYAFLESHDIKGKDVGL